jgi:zinc transport system substrate-binding protein
MSRAALLVVAAALVIAGAGCSATAGTARPDHRTRVVAAFYPLQYVTEQVGGDRVAVTNLVKPGAEPHDLELQPKQIAQLSDADLVVYLRGFQPSVDEGVDQEAPKKSIDVATVTTLHDAPAGGEEKGKDPHIWLDPTRLHVIASAVAQRLATLNPDDRDAILDRADTLMNKLMALDREYSAGLANCQRHEIVTSHAAFGYLAERYHLTQVPITGITPDEDPTPQQFAEVVQKARASGATTVFFETLVSPKIARTLATTVGAKAEVLDPLEGLEPGSTGDYLSVMRSNLATLRTALGCS